jgi:HK97 family phage prohead protease
VRTTESNPAYIKLAPSSSGEFTGIAATWDTDRDGERFSRGDFAETLTSWRKRGALPPLLWQHDRNEPVGVLIAAAETEIGLEITGRIALSTNNGKRAYELLKTGPGALSLSVGFRAKKSADGLFQSVDWMELSLVSMPAQPGAVITNVKQAFPDRKSFEHAARNALNLSASQAKRLAAGGWSALTRQEEEADETNRVITDALTRIANTR